VNLYDVIALEEDIAYELDIDKVEATGATIIPREKLPLTPTRSLGGYFDYGSWEDCERFLELDAAIRRPRRELACGVPAGSEAVSQVRRCTARRAGGYRCENVFESTSDYAGARCPEHRHRIYIHPYEVRARSAA
jgi:hypothetical protein